MTRSDLNALHHPPGVEDGLGDHRCPRHETGQDAGLVAERVEERVHHQVTVAGAEADDGGPGAERAQRLRVRGRRALRVAGRPGGEDQVRHVARAHRCRPCRGLGRVDALSCLHQLGQREHRRRRALAHRLGVGALVAQQDDPAQATDVLALEQRRVVGAQEAAHGQQHRRAGRAQDVARLAALEARVERDEDSAGAQGAEGGQHPLRAVGRPERDAVPRPDAGRDQTAGIAVDLGSQLLVAQTNVAVDERFGSGVAPGGVVDQPRDRPPRQVGSRVFVPRRRTADAHGCWLLTDTTSPLRYDE